MLSSDGFFQGRPTAIPISAVFSSEQQNIGKEGTAESGLPFKPFFLSIAAPSFPLRSPETVKPQGGIDLGDSAVQRVVGKVGIIGCCAQKE